ncbi:MAG TPA: hypothetical protein VF754_09450 [Pyrinomonadaceae bacterium]
MRCTKIEKLLPLYVGDDLNGTREASQVAVHLSECVGCRRRAEELEASRRLLTLHAPPAFDDAFFEGVRRNVMREIEDESQRPAPLFHFGRFFAPRTLAVAASLALLVACALVAALQLYRQHAAPQQQPLTAERTLRETPAPVALDARTPEQAAHQDVHRPKPLGSSAQPSRVTRPRASHPTQTLARRSAAHGPSAPHETQQPTQLASVASGNTPATLPAVAEREVTRIELQTGDPNVRIIWLSPRTDDTPAIKRETKR